MSIVMVLQILLLANLHLQEQNLLAALLPEVLPIFILVKEMELIMPHHTGHLQQKQTDFSVSMVPP
jgi:hypothetical protein